MTNYQLKKIGISFTLLLIISCSSNSKKEEKNLKQSELYYNEGTVLLYEQKYTQALDNLIKAFHLTPEDDRVHNNLGMAYYFKKNTLKATRHLKKAIELNPDNLDAKSNLGFVYMQTKKYSSAEKLFLDVSKSLTYRLQYRTYYNLGAISFRKNDLDEAMKYFNQSIKENENYCPSLYWIARIKYTRKNYSEAKDAFKDSIRGNCFDNTEAHYYLGLNYLQLGEVSEARISFNQIIDRFPDSSYAQKAQLKMNELRSNEDFDKDYISSQLLKEKLESYKKKTYSP